MSETKLSQSALFSACKMIEEFTGTCPADLKDWEHPDGCASHCDSGCEINCWKTYFISENERNNHE